MNTPHSSRSDHALPANWQLLGELELPVDSNTDDSIHTWLMGLLVSRNLQEDFLNKVLQSAQDCMKRALQLNAEAERRHIHFSIYSLNEHTAPGRTWGFFRIEKIDSRDKDHLDQVVEFYLYQEE